MPFLEIATCERGGRRTASSRPSPGRQCRPGRHRTEAHADRQRTCARMQYTHTIHVIATVILLYLSGVCSSLSKNLIGLQEHTSGMEVPSSAAKQICGCCCCCCGSALCSSEDSGALTEAAAVDRRASTSVEEDGDATCAVPQLSAVPAAVLDLGVRLLAGRKSDQRLS